ncbi:MAG TPA: class I SAM-dependent methyltransferase [Phnomibacter sp.]|nr:class I SAM-dependent methyltransferase [Phnomibacter sp.]
MQLKQNVQCPVCLSNALELRFLSSEYIIKALERYYEEEIPDLQILDYHQYKCSNCTLEFFNPMVPGSERFYEFISHQPGYYPRGRWEWHETLKRGIKTGDEKLLEIGCGNGDFLRTAKKYGLSSAFGIDTSASSIKVCEARGLHAYCGNIETYLEEHPAMQFYYDLVASYHCLEHVPDPLLFIQQAKALLKASGKIFLSTPYSPMSFETNWYDPLNHPPHHLTRWNKRAYEELAAKTQMDIAFHSLGAPSVWSRTVTAFNIGQSGKFGSVSNKRTAMNILRYPSSLWKELKNQQGREKIAGKPAPDMILIELTIGGNK